MYFLNGSETVMAGHNVRNLKVYNIEVNNMVNFQKNRKELSVKPRIGLAESDQSRDIKRTIWGHDFVEIDTCCG